MLTIAHHSSFNDIIEHVLFPLLNINSDDPLSLSKISIRKLFDDNREFKLGDLKPFDKNFPNTYQLSNRVKNVE